MNFWKILFFLFLLTIIFTGMIVTNIISVNIMVTIINMHIITVCIIVTSINIIIILLVLFGIFKSLGNRTEENPALEEIILLPPHNNSKTLKFDVINFENELKHALTNNHVENNFNSIPEAATKSTLIALQNKNRNKNKDRYNIPYDCSRVVLQEMSGLGSDDYINANYIDSCGRPKAFIACQGPKFYTIKDFWRMIWQEEVESIVMATNFIENRKRMCAEYWPQRLDSIFDCGEMGIKLIKEEMHEYYVSRVFQIYYKRDTRQILHLHLKWSSDSQDPFYPSNIVPLVNRIREIYERSRKPIVIHSSFGRNRAGVLILCQLALQMAKIDKNINFDTLVKKMRDQRPNMINNLQQYRLAHLIVLECIMEEESPFKVPLNKNINMEVIQQQLGYLERICWFDTMVNSWMSQRKLESNALHSSFVDGYGRCGKYLITQEPTEHTILEFWKLIKSESITCILFLNKIKLKGKLQLWPYRNDSSLVVINVRNLDVSITSYCTLTKLLLQVYEKSSGQVLHEKKVFFFELRDWEPNQIVPNCTNNILNIINDVNKISKSKKRILVGCKNGYTACGLFAALSYAIEKYDQELVVDVCNAVRIVRRCSSRFVNSSKQLCFIHTAISDYLENFESYKRIEE